LTSIQSYQDESVTLEVWGEFLLTQIPDSALEMAVNLPPVTLSQLLTSCLVMTSHQHLTSSIMRSYLMETSFQRMTSSQDNPFSYPEPILRAVNGARQGALAKSISNWHLIGYNEGYCSNNVYIFYHVFMVSGFGFGQSPSSHRA
jgi:hypothetical protein